ncbi:MAG: hypothetical protein QOH35_5558 [Acidobacteriaceae bacterium]|nr:hypothetical protein [Acidobacteriaceae bacterium]
MSGSSGTAPGPSVLACHAFPDAAGTLQDGSGRFRVLLKTMDSAGHSTWTERPVVVASSPSSALAPSSPLLPGLLESGLLQDVLDLPPGEGSASHLSDALAVAPVGATLHFSGYLDVPSDGGYTLSVLASGHTTLAIDGRVLARSPKERALVCGTLGYATQAAVEAGFCARACIASSSPRSAYPVQARSRLNGTAQECCAPMCRTQPSSTPTPPQP